MPTPCEQQSGESQQHERRAARLGHRDTVSYCLRQIAGDDVLAKGIAEESKVASFEAMGRALCCERVHPRHRVPSLDHAEIEVQSYRIEGIDGLKSSPLNLRTGVNTNGLGASRICLSAKFRRSLPEGTCVSNSRKPN